MKVQRTYLPLVAGDICYHQNLLLFSSHVSHGCGEDSSFSVSDVCLCPSAGCSLVGVVSGGIADPVEVADGQGWRQGLDEKLCLPVTLWVPEPLDMQR